jgi:aquaporin Z
VLYWVVQLVAGLLAALLLNLFFSGDILSAAKYGAPAPGSGISSGQAFAAEALLTFFLVTVVYATAIDPRGAFGKIAGLAIGLVLWFDILVGGPLTGAAMNPARAFGPSVAAGLIDANHFLVYWAGPVVGAIAAAVLYQWLLIRDGSQEEVPPPSPGDLDS